MKFDRPDIVYRNGLLAERHRYRVSDVPLRYRHTWSVRRAIKLEGAQVNQHDQHHVRSDDTGNLVAYAFTETLGTGLTKHQAMSLLDRKDA